jgi:hypothetical protein
MNIEFTDGYKASHNEPFPVDQLGKNGSKAFVIKVRLDSGPYPEGTLVPVMVDGKLVG